MDCKIENQPILDAVTAINNVYNDLTKAGEKFVSGFTGAIKDMQGEAKDELESFFNTAYKDLAQDKEKGIPAMVKGLADLLEVNRQQFAQTDHNIAQKIQEANKG